MDTSRQSCDKAPGAMMGHWWQIITNHLEAEEREQTQDGVKKTG